jgi:hypothetical protein
MGVGCIVVFSVPDYFRLLLVENYLTFSSLVAVRGIKQALTNIV